MSDLNKYICLLTLLAPLVGATQDELPMTPKKNVVKFVLTPTVFYDDAFVMGYERVLKGQRSVSVAAGKVNLPNVFAGSHIIQVDKQTNKGGFMLASDFRFYLQKENKHPAPRGIYIGPFTSYYQFKRDWELHGSSSGTATNALLRGELGFFSIGGQIGYQFIVKDRFTFDFIFFGPSITNYRFDLDLQGNFTVEEENEVIRALLDGFPLLGDLLDDKELTVQGVNSTWAGGYRFTCMIGYNFGRKQ